MVPLRAASTFPTCMDPDSRTMQSTGLALPAEQRRVGPHAARGRRRVPGLLRHRRLPEVQMVNGAAETWSIGYLTDVILTRDPWMHRLDLARATGQAPMLTSDHDGVIVADVVHEWARPTWPPVTSTAWAAVAKVSAWDGSCRWDDAVSHGSARVPEGRCLLRGDP